MPVTELPTEEVVKLLEKMSRLQSLTICIGMKVVIRNVRSLAAAISSRSCLRELALYSIGGQGIFQHLLECCTTTTVDTLRMTPTPVWFRRSSPLPHGISEFLTGLKTLQIGLMSRTVMHHNALVNLGRVRIPFIRDDVIANIGGRCPNIKFLSLQGYLDGDAPSRCEVSRF